MTRVFVSYRRRDAGDLVDGLDHALSRAFGRENVYRDVVSIPAGRDWLKSLTHAIRACDVVLAVMGPDWAGGTGGDGSRRIDDRRDVVRVEIATALSERVPVIPVLTDRAVMPRPEELPLNVAGLTRLNALSLRRAHLQADIAHVVEAARAQPARRGETFLSRLDEARRPGDLVGTWVSRNPGDALLEFTFHPDGTYESTGALRQERRSGSMLFESYQAGEYTVTGGRIGLTPFRSSTSRRDPDFPEEDYVNRPERAADSEYSYTISGAAPDEVLVLVDQRGRRIPYRRLG
ncbi:toll/interleukin-1 receptor domain-containing protein [Sphaerisporangium sp. TRM90804]|uniref:toll/interleukin-1 receptor domain-containing protein n=1 Tax=Sphaerisporangium sp. TRM90804 TaxID=3031113 RepID=UPI00244BCBBC|nr:toll/interleukin-1 receptor domain-containing protein [Sphaerisporangium sp. TRM90804]MDH2424869.1 toll/interleukin-1 receptor domain-containing protein [Sphaerisporangium sp. TRM90804]